MSTELAGPLPLLSPREQSILFSFLSFNGTFHHLKVKNKLIHTKPVFQVCQTEENFVFNVLIG